MTLNPFSLSLTLRLTIGVLTAGIGASLTLCQQPEVLLQTTDATAMLWQNDLAAGRKLAETRHAPLLVVFRCER